MPATNLQEQLVRLASAAGVVTDEEFFWVPDTSGTHDPRFKEPGLVPDMLPGASGQLSSSEVGLVESWLHAAGYMIQSWAIELDSGKTGVAYQATTDTDQSVVTADTLHAALTAAVMQLELPDEAEKKNGRRMR